MTHRNAFALAGRKLFGTLTRGDAYALPRADRFWAFSPKNIALLSKCTKLCLDLQVELRENCFEVVEITIQILNVGVKNKLL